MRGAARSAEEPAADSRPAGGVAGGDDAQLVEALEHRAGEHLADLFGGERLAGVGGGEDGLGDVCDPDLDGDRVDNDVDNCPELANRKQEDKDKDGLGDECDPSPTCGCAVVGSALGYPGWLKGLGLFGLFLVWRRRSRARVQ